MNLLLLLLLGLFPITSIPNRTVPSLLALRPMFFGMVFVNVEFNLSSATSLEVSVPLLRHCASLSFDRTMCILGRVINALSYSSLSVRSSGVAGMLTDLTPYRVDMSCTSQTAGDNIPNIVGIGAYLLAASIVVTFV